MKKFVFLSKSESLSIHQGCEMDTKIDSVAGSTSGLSAKRSSMVRVNSSAVTVAGDARQRDTKQTAISEAKQRQRKSKSESKISMAVEDSEKLQDNGCQQSQNHRVHKNGKKCIDQRYRDVLPEFSVEFKDDDFLLINYFNSSPDLTLQEQSVCFQRAVPDFIEDQISKIYFVC